MRDRLIELLGDYLYSEQIADHLLANGVTVQEWVSVTDKLPESKKCVLMYSADGGVAEGEYDESTKKWCQYRWSVCDIRKVTHWMPLPQPPKGE